MADSPLERKISSPPPSPESNPGRGLDNAGLDAPASIGENPAVPRNPSEAPSETKEAALEGIREAVPESVVDSYPAIKNAGKTDKKSTPEFSQKNIEKPNKSKPVTNVEALQHLLKVSSIIGPYQTVVALFELIKGIESADKINEKISQKAKQIPK